MDREVKRVILYIQPSQPLPLIILFSLSFSPLHPPPTVPTLGASSGQECSIMERRAMLLGLRSWPSSLLTTPLNTVSRLAGWLEISSLEQRREKLSREERRVEQNEERREGGGGEEEDIFQ